MFRAVWEFADTLDGAFYSCICVAEVEIHRMVKCVNNHAKRIHHKIKTRKEVVV